MQKRRGGAGGKRPFNKIAKTKENLPILQKSIAGKEYNLTRKVIKGDGNYLFRAYSYLDLRDEKFHNSYRMMAYHEIKTNKNTYESYYTSEDEYLTRIKEELNIEYITFDDYVELIGVEGVWAGDMELEALSSIYKTTIFVYLPGDLNPIGVFGEENLGEGQQPYLLEYTGSCHYNCYINAEVTITESELYKTLQDLNTDNKYLQLAYINNTHYYQDIDEEIANIDENVDNIYRCNSNPERFPEVFEYLTRKKIPHRFSEPKQKYNWVKRLKDKKGLCKYTIIEGHLAIRWAKGFHNGYFKVPFTSEIEDMLEECDDNEMHNNIRETIEQFRIRGFYFPNIRETVKSYIEDCQCSTITYEPYPPPHRKIIISRFPFDRIVIDFTLLPQNIAEFTNYNYLLCAIDHFSKFLWIIPTDNKQSTTVLAFLEYIRRNSRSNIINLCSDNGKEFKNKLIADFCKKNNINQIFGSPYHPKTQGSIEVAQRYIKEKIKKMITLSDKENASSEISNCLQKYLHWYNFIKTHSTTKAIPRKSILLNPLEQSDEDKIV